jgi:membrane-anchored glycerophosphoryl diester phosphodiesterase (GDPDase)
LQYFEFIGKLFALSLIKNDYFVAPSFSLVVYKMILGEKIKIEDLKSEFDEGEVITNVEKLR